LGTRKAAWREGGESIGSAMGSESKLSKNRREGKRIRRRGGKEGEDHHIRKRSRFPRQTGTGGKKWERRSHTTPQKSKAKEGMQGGRILTSLPESGGLFEHDGKKSGRLLKKITPRETNSSPRKKGHRTSDGRGLEGVVKRNLGWPLETTRQLQKGASDKGIGGGE